MPEQLHFQIVTRAARRRVLEEAEQTQAVDANPLTAGVPAVTATVQRPATNPQRTLNSAPLVAPTTARRRRTRRTATGRSASTRTRPQAGDDRHVAITQLAWDRIEQEVASHYQELGLGGLYTWNDMLNWMDSKIQRAGEVSSIPSAPTQQPDRCTSRSCPIPSTIPHNRGLYLHEGQANRYPERWELFGLSNPPSGIWRRVDRVLHQMAQPGDHETVEAFARHHRFMEGVVHIKVVNNELIRVSEAAPH